MFGALAVDDADDVHLLGAQRHAGQIRLGRLLHERGALRVWLADTMQHCLLA